MGIIMIGLKDYHTSLNLGILFFTLPLKVVFAFLETGFCVRGMLSV